MSNPLPQAGPHDDSITIYNVQNGFLLVHSGNPVTEGTLDAVSVASNQADLLEIVRMWLTTEVKVERKPPRTGGGASPPQKMKDM